MLKVVFQHTVKNTTLLITDNPIPFVDYKAISIDSKLYEPLDVYDLDNALAIVGTGDFVGKEIKLV